MKKNFILLGAAGFVAPRHMAAIKAVGGNLTHVYDPHDSVGILDRYFPECEYRSVYIYPPPGTDYAVICSPNHLHAQHIRRCLPYTNVICEKPLFLHPDNATTILAMQRKFKHKVYTILQLRHHPDVLKVKSTLKPRRRYKVNVDYSAPRGAWYKDSWKGDPAKSGGICTNIGIHLFDLLIFLFGNKYEVISSEISNNTARGEIRFKNRDVWTTAVWRLTTEEIKPVRKIIINDAPINLSKKFEDLHTDSYEQILVGNGWTVDDALPSIRMVKEIKNG